MQRVEIKLIDRTVRKAQQNKMADWWGESNNVLIPSLRENAKNKKKTKQVKQIALSRPFKMDKEVQNNMKFSRSNTQQLVR